MCEADVYLWLGMPQASTDKALPWLQRIHVLYLATAGFSSVLATCSYTAAGRLHVWGPFVTHRRHLIVPGWRKALGGRSFRRGTLWCCGLQELHELPGMGVRRRLYLD